MVHRHRWPSLFVVWIGLVLVITGCASLDPGTGAVTDGIDRPPEEELIKAKVVRVIDGDTIVARVKEKEERIRFIGVDTPETVHPEKGEEPFGKEASDFTKTHLPAGGTIFLEMDAEERDHYGRLLAYIWVEEELFNASLLQEGLATTLTIPPNVKYRDEFRALEQESREKEVGLWGEEEASGGQGSGNDPAVTGTGGCEGQIKGNVNRKGEKIYHVPGGPNYEQVKEEEWFCTEEEAKSAGYRSPRGQ
ncbi:thermonuclease family protein [Desmospora profundinema]|nr:thermonuclease family protein [Desmospora profundinema]